MTKTTIFILLLILSLNSLAEELSGKVVSVTDGDTLTLKVDRKKHKIRLAGIDTPEKDQPWGKEAKKALVDKVRKKIITVEVVDTDRYGRLVGKVYLGERYINKELVASPPIMGCAVRLN